MLEAFYIITTLFFIWSFIKNSNHQLALRLVFFVFIWFLWFKSLVNWNFYLPVLNQNLFLVDNLSAIFLVLFSMFGIGFSFFTKFYYWEYQKHWKNTFFYELLTNLFILAMFFVIIANEAITFLVSWEIMSLSSFFLVVHEFKKPWILKSWAWYFIIAHIWMFFILFSFIPFIGQTHSTFFDSFKNANLSVISSAIVFFSALIWFGSKAWLFPVHVWLPKAHPIAPSNISSLMSWFMVKLPVLMILKVLIIFLAYKVQFSFFVVVLILASISSFLWVFYALIQHNIKKLLAFHTIENIWIIFIWIAILIFGAYIHNNLIITIWLFAAIYHTFNHAIFKGLLFLLSWWMFERTKTYDYTKLWWLLKISYILWFSFLIWAIAIAWIPPLNWFNSELLVIGWLIDWILKSTTLLEGSLFIISLILLWATAVLSLVCFSKVFSVSFLGNKRDETIKYERINNIFEKISYLLFDLYIFLLALIPWVIYFVVEKVLNKNIKIELFNLNIGNINYTPLIIFILIIIFGTIIYIFYKNSKQKIKWVWNCWYPYIEPKTQYTSTSFIQPIRRIYSKLYMEASSLNHISKKQSEQRIFKKELKEIKHDINHNYFIDFIYDYLIKIIKNISLKFKTLQNWKVESYVFYMFLAIIVAIIYLYYFN